MRIDATKVVAVMKEKDIRQKDLVFRSGLSRNTVSAICNRKSCSEDTAQKIAAALGVTVDDLIETK